METLGDIKAAVRAHGFESDQDPNIVVLANYEQRRVIGEHRWRFLIETKPVSATAGTVTYALPASPKVMHIEAIRFTATSQVAGTKMRPVDAEELLDAATLDISDDQGGAPTLWAEVGPGVFQIFPAPLIGGVFSVRYQRPAAELVVDADVPDIPAAYLDIIVAGICSDLAGRQRQWDAKREFATERDERARAMRAQYGMPQRQDSGQVRRTGRFGNRTGRERTY